MAEVPTEHEEQVAFVRWFRLAYKGTLIFAIPNGGQRNKITAAKLKAEGVKKGIPDLFIPAWRTWIEMKRAKGGSLPPDQKDMIEHLKLIGYTVLVAKGAQDAINQIKKEKAVYETALFEK